MLGKYSINRAMSPALISISEHMSGVTTWVLVLPLVMNHSPLSHPTLCLPVFLVTAPQASPWLLLSLLS